MATRIKSWDSSLSWQCCLIWRGPIRAVAIHFGVGMETAALFFARALDAVSNSGGRVFRSRAGDVAIFHGGDFDVEIDAVEERARDALAITLDLDRAATALAFQIAVIPAGTRIHDRDEHELGGKRHAPGGARHRDFAVLERMTVSPLTHHSIGRSPYTEPYSPLISCNALNCALSSRLGAEASGQPLATT